MKRTKIFELLQADTPEGEVLIKGWIRTRRDAKGFSFIEVNDGSYRGNIQVVADQKLDNYSDILKLSTGSAVAVTGRLVASQGAGQDWEIQASEIEIISVAPESYPLQKKRHSDEFLRTIAHLRPRTNKYGAAFRIRSEVSYAIHRFFKERGFIYIHTPIVTASDCEGAGEMFRVTTLDPDNIPKVGGHADYSLDFFGRQANLTVSGPAGGEALLLAPRRRLHLRPHLRGRKLQYTAPRRRILDGGAGDGLLRPGRGHGSRRRDGKIPGRLRDGPLP